MQGKKVMYLLAALGLPIFVFLFLKFCGRNEFNVEPLFQEGIIEPMGDCERSYKTPYAISDSVFAQYKIAETTFTVIAFTDTLRNPMIQQLSEELKSDSVTFFNVVNENTFLTKNSDQNLSLVSNDQFNHDGECIFLLKEPFNTVLVNQNGVIYGQYDSRDRYEVDRLLAELLILLKKY